MAGQTRHVHHHGGFHWAAEPYGPVRFDMTDGPALGILARGPSVTAESGRKRGIMCRDTGTSGLAGPEGWLPDLGTRAAVGGGWGAF